VTLVDRDVTPEEIDAYGLAKRLERDDAQAAVYTRGAGFMIKGRILDPERVANGYTTMPGAVDLAFYVQKLPGEDMRLVFFVALKEAELPPSDGARCLPDEPALMAWIDELRGKVRHRVNLRTKRQKLRGLKIRRLTVQIAAFTKEHGFKIDVAPHRRGALLTVHLVTHGARLLVRLDKADEVLRMLPALLWTLRDAPARGLVEISLDTWRK
jgi:hypothetical protein